MRFHPELEWAVSWPVLIVTPVVYLATVFALKRLMQHRAGFNLLILLRVFNGVQIGLSLLMCWQLCGNLSLWNPFMLNSEFTKNLEWWLFVHYLAKYWDLFESAFIVLRKREAQLNSLHLFHHCSILVIWGWLLHIGLANGTAAYGAFINSFVHAVMYGMFFGLEWWVGWGGVVCRVGRLFLLIPSLLAQVTCTAAETQSAWLL